MDLTKQWLSVLSYNPFLMVLFLSSRIPTLQDLGFPAGECLYSNTGGWIGGETMALRRLVEYCKTRSKQQAENYVSEGREREEGGRGEGEGEREGGREREREREREMQSTKPFTALLQADYLHTCRLIYSLTRHL